MAFLTYCRLCGGRVSSEADSCLHCGHPSSGSGEDWIAGKAREFLRKNEKIGAIKAVREMTGWDLVEAKLFVESL
jgi:hypothetical protein